MTQKDIQTIRSAGFLVSLIHGRYMSNHNAHEHSCIIVSCYKFGDNGCYNLKGLYVSNYLIGNM